MRIENPYSPPTALSARADDREPLDVIKQRLSRPATALIIMASIQSVLVSIPLVSAVVIGAQGRLTPNDSWYILISSVQFFCLLLIAIGAAKMGHIESYPMARLAGWLACIPFITPFMIVGIPFGIWSLRLLAAPETKAAFDRTNGHKS